MENDAKSKIFYGAGCSLGINRAKVIAQFSPVSIEYPESFIYEWTRENGWSKRKIILSARRICELTQDITETIVMGEGGYILVISNNDISEEMVDDSVEGPLTRGNLRDMQLIGGHLYAVGMNRQVYRREHPGRWLHVDRGVVKPIGSLDITGFCSIDGRSEKEIYAAGFNGEIWFFNGSEWKKCDTPTNVIIHKIKFINSDLVFACGQQGVLLRGARDVWEVIDHDRTNQNLWSMEWYNGFLYVVEDTRIYYLDKEDLVDLNVGVENCTFRNLAAGFDALWSFGNKHILVFDGKSWEDVTRMESGRE